MNRDYWTIYDDDVRDFEQELIINDDFDNVLKTVLRMSMAAQGTLDHFEQESDLFEV